MKKIFGILIGLMLMSSVHADDVAVRGRITPTDTNVTSARAATTSNVAPVAVRSTNAARGATSTSNDTRATSARSATPSTSVRSAAPRATAARSAMPTGSTAPRATAARSGTNVVGSNVIQSSSARSATPSTSARAATNVGRAAVTGSVGTVSLGVDYENCKNVYYACMDEFCTIKNSNWRRCSCSARSSEFAAEEQKIKQATASLEEFNTRLSNVNLTSAQVRYMNTATEGEGAMTDDVSDARADLQAVRSELGGATAIRRRATTTNGLGNPIDLSVDWDAAFNDVSNFMGASNVSADKTLSSLDGEALYNNIHSQCQQLAASSCSTQNLQMVTNAYSMAIEQDCVAVAKAYDAQKSAILKKVQEGGQLLSEARLEDYNAKNSADFIACLSDLKSHMLDPVVCDKNYKKCLDNTGKYVNASTGNYIFGPGFNDLNKLLTFPANGSDKLSSVSSNANFVEFLNQKRPMVQSTLDKCQNIQDAVWTEFIDQSLVQIVQAQNDLISQVRNTCIKTIADCHKNTENDLNAFDSDSQILFSSNTKVTTKAICADTIKTCSQVYGLTGSEADVLDDFTAEVLDSKVAAGCTEKVKECFAEVCGASPYTLCQPTDKATLRATCETRAAAVCGSDGNATAIDIAMDEIQSTMDKTLSAKCKEVDGIWKPATTLTAMVLPMVDHSNNMFARIINGLSDFVMSSAHAAAANNDTLSNATMSVVSTSTEKLVANWTAHTSWGKCLVNYKSDAKKACDDVGGVYSETQNSAAMVMPGWSPRADWSGVYCYASAEYLAKQKAEADAVEKNRARTACAAASKGVTNDSWNHKTSIEATFNESSNTCKICTKDKTCAKKKSICMGSNCPQCKDWNSEVNTCKEVSL